MYPQHTHTHTHTLDSEVVSPNLNPPCLHAASLRLTLSAPPRPAHPRAPSGHRMRSAGARVGSARASMEIEPRRWRSNANDQRRTASASAVSNRGSGWRAIEPLSNANDQRVTGDACNRRSAMLLSPRRPLVVPVRVSAPVDRAHARRRCLLSTNPTRRKPNRAVGEGGHRWAVGWDSRQRAPLVGSMYSLPAGMYTDMCGSVSVYMRVCISVYVGLYQ
jgi:hypothetical protein